MRRPIEEVAERFHDFYFERLGVSVLVNARWKDMPEHQAALKFALLRLEEEGLICIADAD